ncbi:MAG TPA: universal stress protein [Candidatus Limnocylindria bacterium]|jgi:nucleotide-binding universal stress UspA family protein
MRLLFATDGSRGAGVAEDFLLALPLAACDEVTVLTAPTVSERESQALLARCRWRFAARNVPTKTVVRTGDVAVAAEGVALERGAELIVLGSRGLGQLSGTLMGSVARGVARGSLPVLVVRSRREAPRRVLLAIDGSADARAAVDLLARFPLPMAARIELLEVRSGAADSLRVERLLAEARARLAGRLDRLATIDRCHLGEAVLQRALTPSADLIVLGAEGQTAGAGLMRVSIADHVLSHAHCAVLIGKAPTKPRLVDAVSFVPAAV